MIYVGSAADGKYDQELDSILVGPIPVGVNKFVFKANAPDASKIPQKDLLGVTVCMVTCFYKNQEFIRIGYYVNNELCDENASGAINMKTKDPETNKEDDAMEVDDESGLLVDEDSNSQPAILGQKVDVAKIRRNILAAKPRVTRYSINWEDDDKEEDVSEE